MTTFLTVNPIGVVSPVRPPRGNDGEIVVDPINRGDAYFERISFCD